MRRRPILALFLFIALLCGCTIKQETESPPNVESRKPLWRAKLGAAATSLLASDNHIIAATAKHLTALDVKTGKNVWKAVPETGAGYCTLFDHTLYCGGAGGVSALRADSGQEIWNVPTDEPVTHAPSAYEDLVCYSYGDIATSVVCAARANGHIRWEFIGRGGASPITLTPQAVFFATPYAFYSLSKRNGAQNWQKEIQGYSVSQAVYEKGILYFGTEGGGFYAVKGEDGKVIWDFPVKDAVPCAPAMHRDRIFFGSFDGNVYALDKKLGKMIWQHRARDARPYCVTVSGNTVYAGLGRAGSKPSGALLALNADSGTPSVRVTTNHDITLPPVLISNHVIFTTNRGVVIAVEK